MAGRSGLAGWQWLFMVEGVMTVGIGIVWLFLLPDKPTYASPVLLPKWKMLNERQALQPESLSTTHKSPPALASISVFATRCTFSRIGAYGNMSWFPSSA